MKIAIYGVSRSGKNYLIERLINHLNTNSNKTVFHLKGSETLNQFAKDKFGKLFKELVEDQKEQLRKEFTFLINELDAKYDLVVVDGHYAFIDGEDYHVVFTENDRAVYDAFFYLDTPATSIIEYSKNSTGAKKNLWITEEDVIDWKFFEITRLKDICDSLDKELFIFDEDTNSCINFIDEYVNDDIGKFDYKKVANYISNSLINYVEKSTNVLLIDCDKTVSENDVTYTYCNELEVNTSQLKKIFTNDRYSTFQFYKFAKLFHSKSAPEIELAAKKASSELKLNDKTLQNIKSFNGVVIGISSGIYEIWSSVLQEKSITQTLIACSDLKNMKFLITPKVKAEVTRLLQLKGKKVMALGDSLIDVPMLEISDGGFIIAHEKISEGVARYFRSNPKSKIKQLACSNFYYQKVIIEGAIS